MDGTAWIASYVVICFTLVGFALALAALYREAGIRKLAGAPWPFTRVRPGEYFPLTVARDAVTATVNGAASDEPNPRFYLLTGFEDDALPAVMSTAITAAGWNIPYTVFVPDSDDPMWLSALPPEVCRHVERLDSHSARSLGAQTIPALAFVNADRLIDAASDASTPRKIREHFGLTAQPLETMPSLFRTLGKDA